MSKNQLLLLTGCINPDGMAFTALQDCNERYRQYLESLEYYLNNTNSNILFVENSDYNIDLMKKKFYSFIMEGQLEILSFQGNNFDRSRGKGYGESIILEYAINNSRMIKNADVIIKITGRLKCSNIKLIQWCCKKSKVTANIVFDQWNRLECLSHIFAAPVAFFTDYFLENKEKLDDSKNYWFEHLLLDSVKNWKNDGGEFGEFIIQPLMEGQRGSVDARYTTTIKERIAYPLQYWRHKKIIKSL